MCIEPGVNNCQRGSMGNFDHYAYGNNVRGAGEACRRQGIAFLPMVVESFGGWHEVSGPNISASHQIPAGPRSQQCVLTSPSSLGSSLPGFTVSVNDNMTNSCAASTQY